MISFLISALKIIFLLGFLIFIHEGGHFLIAKLCKVKVNEFAIGFGPTIWKRQGKETKYALRLIPLGGFVSMEGEEERSDAEGSFSKASIPRRIAIVLAGGIVNIIFGLLVYFVLVSFLAYPTGNTTEEGKYISNVVEEVSMTNPESKDTLQVRDKILAINGKKIRIHNDLNKELTKANGEDMVITVERNGQKQELSIKPVQIPMRSTGIAISAKEGKAPEILQVTKGSTAEKQGLEVKDVIIAINDQEIGTDPQKVLEMIQSTQEGQAIKIKVKRGGEEREFNLLPDETVTYKLGISLAPVENPNLGERLYYGYFDTINFSVSIIDNLKQLFQGGISVDQLMGPVGISEYVASTNGIKEFIAVLALISLSLGVTNLLPFPPLDGGKVVLLLIEAIRRKPLKENTELTIQMIGFGALILLSIYITYNDILRIF